MFNNIDILTWVLLFITSFVFDVFTVVYTKAIVEKRGLLAANVSVILFLLGIYGTINCVNNAENIIPISLGYWIGSFCSVYKWKKKTNTGSDVKPDQYAGVGGSRDILQ